ncbi:NAD(P)-dependent oxidoreductase [Armatimonas rosea]|uniref:3-hydroxyisobutyrate dehydrogenase-like beta-hydroxyacid dehydrogenase n=1 Tax=Armatimonas rosea TaxID=685828 RepID=A0A7W9W7X8_ARMRO|nr:NAD(P)-dependent oxidoreductase [Armatimonas rosea]MBB6052924.1 3-hydroxyisobutyrate dehydrogenase-like beta-hydroxyacid dehydrogenase [Armatimonas rosea]
MSDPQKRVGLIGLGLVGSALAERFLAHGYQVVGYDLDTEKRKALVERGGIGAGSPAAVTERVERLVLSLPTTEVVLDVLGGASGILAASSLPTTILDTTTGDPSETEALAAALATRGIAYMDTAISGSSKQVRGGEATLLVGGTPAAYAASADLLACVTDRVFHLGSAGSGSRAKLATNLILGLNRAALAEGLVFAEALGLDLAVFLDVLKNSPAYSVAVDIKGEKMRTGEFTPESRVLQHKKDVGLILAAAHATGQELPLSQVHHTLLTEAVEAGEGELDNAVIIEAIRRKRR